MNSITIPGVKEQVEYQEVATPKTIKRFTLNPEGTAYGFAQIPGGEPLFRVGLGYVRRFHRC